jgi:hypothetical protein
LFAAIVAAAQVAFVTSRFKLLLLLLSYTFFIAATVVAVNKQLAAAIKNLTLLTEPS